MKYASPVVITLMLHAEVEPDGDGNVGVHVNGLNFTTMGHFPKEVTMTEAQKTKVVELVQKVGAKALLNHLEGQQLEQPEVPASPFPPAGGASA